MESVSPQTFLSPTDSLGRVAGFVSFVALSIMVFCLDTFTDVESAIAVLYGLAILVVSELLTTRGMVWTAGFLAALTLLSYLLTFSDRNFAADLGLFVSLAAIGTTTAVLTRHRTSTNRLQATNAALKRSETRFRAIFEQSRVALWEQDFTKLKAKLVELRNSGVSNLRRHMLSSPAFLSECASLIETVSVNDATLHLLGRTAEEITGSVQNFIPQDEECLFDLVDCLFQDRLLFEGKGRIVRPDGSTISVLLALSFPEEDVGLDRVVVGMFDVTQRDRAQQALLAAQTEMAKASRVATVAALSASLAHELNQPTGAVVLNAQSCLRWLRREPPNIASAVEATERIVRDAHRVSSILKSTRQMIMRNTARSEPTDLGELIGETCMLLDHELTTSSIVLQTRVPAQMPKMMLARAELQQVLVNLLNNGIQAVASGGGTERKLAVECAVEGKAMVTISIRDFGPGIDQGILPKLFDPFFTTKESGMGIGLSICRAMVEAQGGRLVARNHESGGAVFQLWLPMEHANG